jgi:hypothetical protein
MTLYSPNLVWKEIYENYKTSNSKSLKISNMFIKSKQKLGLYWMSECQVKYTIMQVNTLSSNRIFVFSDI